MLLYLGIFCKKSPFVCPVKKTTYFMKAPGFYCGKKEADVNVKVSRRTVKDSPRRSGKLNS